MIDNTWIASRSFARMSIAAARAARGWVVCAAHSLKLVWFLALYSSPCPITSCHVDWLAGGARGHCFRGDAVQQPT